MLVTLSQSKLLEDSTCNTLHAVFFYKCEFISMPPVVCTTVEAFDL